MQNYVYIQTYGCSANQNNSEILAGILRSSGYQITNNQDIADIIILNTCVVKNKTENKIKRRIQDISKKSSAKLLIITGCMPETDAKQIKKLDSNTILLGTHHIKDIVNIIKEKQKQYLDYQNETKLNLPKIPKNKLISITQISEGCLGNCTYCKTRLAKGKLFSYPQEEIIKSIKSDLQQGAKEVWITSQDNANYGLDKSSISSQNKSVFYSFSKLSKSEDYQDNNKDNYKLPSLLNNILELKHNFKLRLGMMDPNNVLPIINQLIEVYQNKKIYKFLHIPIQSASNKVLKDMNRFYTIGQAEKIINKFKKEIPDITIATDIITGYPTETEKAHQANINFIKKHQPDVFNLSKFSSHKQTPAGKLKQLPIDIINKRTTELMNIHRQTAQQNKQKFLNKKIKVFVNKKLPNNLYESRDENYNIILINTNKNFLGKNIEVKIIKVGVHHLIGELEN